MKNEASVAELVTNFNINFSREIHNDDHIPTYFNCSFNAFNNHFSFMFKYRSYAFSENTPVYMWNGKLFEKRISGKVR